jgi:hypothetical protein
VIVKHNLQRVMDEMVHFFLGRISISPSPMSSTNRDSMYPSPSLKHILVADMRVEINDLK